MLREHDGVGLLVELHTLSGYVNQAVFVDILVQQVQHQALAYDGGPETGPAVAPNAEQGMLVVVVRFYYGVAIFFGNSRVKGFFNLGPELGVMIADGVSSDFDYHNAATMDYFQHDTRHIEQLTMKVKNRLDYGICAGAGMEINLNAKQSLLLEGRFYYGLTDAFPSHKTDVFSSSNSMTIAVTLGYFYRLK